MMNLKLYSFLGGDAGPWRVVNVRAVRGESLPTVKRLDITNGSGSLVKPATTPRWQLQGVVSNERYVTRSEKQRLVERQPVLGRAEATYATLIPIRKNSEWWLLPQDERRAIIEEHSLHIAIGLDYLPAIARRLHHSRDLGEPFDFITWFEYAPDDADRFDELLNRLRASAEWRYVDREVDIRLVREPA